MTSPVPDALRTQLAEVLARAFYVGLHGDDRSWAESAWDDMGGSEPSEERVEYVLAANEALTVLLASPFLARARAEGAAEELRQVESWAQQHADDRLHDSPVTVGERSGLLMTVMHAREQHAALSAPTTAEGDPT